MTDVTIGQPVKRSEDERFLTGRGRYIDDINLEGQARAAVLRSVYAHADIKNIDASEALAMEGVLLVVTGEDWIAEGFGPMPTKTAVRKNRDGSELSEPPRHCLAIDRVRYVGEPSQLFDLEEDPNELRDLSGNAGLTRGYDARLRRLLDADEVDALARRDQAARVEAFGGREAVLQRGAFDNSPVPGEPAAFRKH